MIRNRVGVWGLSVALVLSGCGGVKEGSRNHPAAEVAPEVAPASESPVVPPGERMVFFDDFREGGAPKWEPMAGEWDLTQNDATVAGYGSMSKGYALAYAGNPNWSNYSISARVNIVDDRQGPVGLVGRGDSDHYYFELVLGRNEKGEKTWSIRERLSHRWNTLATGPYDYKFGTPVVLRLSFRGRLVTGWVSNNGGRSFGTLGEADVNPSRWQIGRAGLVTYGGLASFDDVTVTGPDDFLFSLDTANGWGALSLIRDNTNTFTNGKPSGGWFVTPIHANLRASDGKVLITGFSRKGNASCTSTQVRQNGMTWILDPAVVDSAADNSTMLVTPINEQNRDTAHDVLYCAGHSTLPDGRVFFTAGTRYVDKLPDTSPERGLRYSRMWNPATGSFTRIEANMGGGQSASYPDPGGKGDGGTVRGEKWYPTTTLMPDGTVLIFGGFHFSTGGPGSKANNSFELFDPKVWDANHSANPYTVLLQHGTGSPQGDLPPTRGYSNVFVLPKPVPAGLGNGFARTVAISGGVGRVVLFSHENGPSGSARLFARPNSLTPSPDGTPANERAEGASNVLLTDGRIMFTDGGHTGAGSAKSYFYDPYADSWTSTPQLNMTISRMYGDAVQLPDGKVMVINGYNGNPGGDGAADPEDGNTSDIANPIGDVRRPVLTDPYASPMTAVPQPAWPEVTHRGYHAIGLLLKDGRILVGGGKDRTHVTGCEKNEVRIYTPPYLQGSPTRPTISNISEGQTVTVGGAPFTINYTGTLKSARGVALLKPGSLTHAFDMGQRYVPLTVVSGGGSSGSVTVLPPSNINIAQPGDYILFVIDSAGVPSVGKWMRVAAPANCVYQVDGTANSYLEAETPSRKDGPFLVVGDDNASGNAYVEVADGTGNHTSEPDEGKVMWYDLDITSGGTFFLWGLGNGPDVASDSFWASVDSGPDVQLTGLPAAGFGWVQFNNTLALSTGKHTLKIKVREDFARLDKIALSKSSAFSPTGLGGAALLCNGAPPPPPNAPTTLIASDGTGQASLAWIDGGGGATSYKVERKPQGSPDTSFAQIGTSPTTSFLDTPVAAGSYTYRVRASNAGGDSPYSNSDDATVTAAMGPAAPSNLAASIAAGNVTLTWTDNSSTETGFRVEKKIGAGSFATLASKGVDVQSHVDSNVTAVGTYTYRVIATGTPDSAPSNEVTVVVAAPAADAYVRGSTNGNNTYGASDPNVLLVKNWVTNPENERRIYIRFPLAGISATVTSVKLRLNGNAAGTAKPTSVYGVANTTWGETTITFNNAPAMDASAQATTTVGTTAAWYEWDLTAYVQAQKTAGATDVSFGIKSDPISNDSQTTFSSKEGANDPVLIIGSK